MVWRYLWILTLLIPVSCGRETTWSEITQAVSGGTETAEMEAAGYIVAPGEDRRIKSRCSAVLIGPKTVLTAAHCFTPVPDLDRFFLINAATSENRLTYEYLHEVASVFVHPGFDHELVNRRGWNATNDVALIELSEATEIAPAQLSANPPVAGDPIVIYGYGESEHQLGDAGNKLRIEQRIAMVSDDGLNLLGQPNVCAGDSGAAVFSGEVVVGVLSTGSCEKDGYDAWGAAVRVDAHREWITETAAAWDDTVAFVDRPAGASPIASPTSKTVSTEQPVAAAAPISPQPVKRVSKDEPTAATTELMNAAQGCSVGSGPSSFTSDVLPLLWMLGLFFWPKRTVPVSNTETQNQRSSKMHTNIKLSSSCNPLTAHLVSLLLIAILTACGGSAPSTPDTDQANNGDQSDQSKLDKDKPDDGKPNEDNQNQEPLVREQYDFAIGAIEAGNLEHAFLYTVWMPNDDAAYFEHVGDFSGKQTVNISVFSPPQEGLRASGIGIATILATLDDMGIDEEVTSFEDDRFSNAIILGYSIIHALVYVPETFPEDLNATEKALVKSVQQANLPVGLSCVRAAGELSLGLVLQHVDCTEFEVDLGFSGPPQFNLLTDQEL